MTDWLSDRHPQGDKSYLLICLIPRGWLLSYNGLPITYDEIGNPFRYRGYYYDKDLGWYYLQTRYYNPQWGRFINADDIAYPGANGDLQAYSLFAYCSNNPIAYVDPTGNFIWSGLACFAFEAQNLNSGINF